jgi:hypothetical protein
MFLFLIITLLFSCNVIKKKEESLKTVQVKKWSQLDKSEYSITYPSNWSLDASGQMGTQFFILSPLESETDKFKENVNLLKQDIPSAYSLDSYIQLSTNEIKTQVKNSKIIESKRIKRGGNEFHILKYIGFQNQFYLSFTQYVFIENGQAFVLTFTNETSKEKAYKEIENQIFKSFKLKLWLNN